MIHLQTEVEDFTEFEIPINHIETRINDMLKEAELVPMRQVLSCLLEDDEIVKNIVATLLYTNPDLREEEIKLFSWSGFVKPKKVSGFLVKARGLTIFHRVTLYS